MRASSMKKSTASGREPKPSSKGLWFVLLALLLSTSACKKEATEEQPEEELRCEQDDSEGADTAMNLTAGEEAEGHLCPKLDEDWYAFTLGANDRLLEVSLQMTNPRAPVEPTYAVWSAGAGGSAGEVAAEPPSEAVGVGAVISEVHCLQPGDYFLAVRDQGNDAQDIRNRYRLSIALMPEPDESESNDDADQATRLDSGQARQGYIACGSDQDWYAVSVAQGEVLRVHLESEPSGYQPLLRILAADGNQLAEASNPASSVESTLIDLHQVVPTAGDYFLVVSDDDDLQSDPTVPYTIEVETIRDQDRNEPNNHPGEATPLADSAVACGEQWSVEFEATGTIGSPGDTDWFRLPVTGCGSGLLEAELVFDNSGRSDQEAWRLQSEVQASVALVRSHGGTPCAEDSSCQSLNIECDQGEDWAEWQCQGYYNACGTDGLCVGASVCLPDGTCGANQTERHYRVATEPDPITGPPPPHEVVLSAPVFGGDNLYLRVTDYQSDGGDPGAVYRLRVRIRSEPDANDRGGTPNNLYGNTLTTLNLELAMEQSLDRAVAIPVHDCTAGDCCDAATWAEGAISYQNDFDLFVYDHPCPGTDCSLKLYHRVDDGPVQHGLYLFQGSWLWFTFAIDGDDTFGNDECLYAFQNHQSPYYILIRDYLGEDELAQEQVGIATRWSADQGYSFCIEKYSNQCEVPPCALAANDECTSP